MAEKSLITGIKKNFQIDDRVIGPGEPCLVIGEIAQAHDGSLGNAHAYVDAIAEAGADAIKMQTHIAAAESTAAETFRVPFSRQDATRYEYWKRMEFTEEQWRGLKEHAEERGLVFLSSPFSFEAVDLLERLKVSAWKVGAGELTNLPMLEYMASTGKPVLLSSGMASWSDMDTAMECVLKQGAAVGIFQCTTAYPCPPEEIGLNVLEEMRSRYGCPIGLSDHSGAIYSCLAAVTLGANILEVHTVFSRECFGPDTRASLTTQELKQLVQGVRFIEKVIANPVRKDEMEKRLAELKRVFGKSVVAARKLPAGRRLQAKDLALKKPGTGIPAAQLKNIIGRTLKRPLAADSLISEDDLE